MPDALVVGPASRRTYLRGGVSLRPPRFPDRRRPRLADVAPLRHSGQGPGPRRRDGRDPPDAQGAARRPLPAECPHRDASCRSMRSSSREMTASSARTSCPRPPTTPTGRKIWPRPWARRVPGRAPPARLNSLAKETNSWTQFVRSCLRRDASVDMPRRWVGCGGANTQLESQVVVEIR